MPKLEQKLIELGYRKQNEVFYFKESRPAANLRFGYQIKIGISSNGLIGYIDTGFVIFNYQQEIDNLQHAFNQLQNDLKELKEDENI